MNQPLFVDANLKRQPARSNAAIPRRRPSVSKGRRMKSSSHERSSTGCQSFPPRPPSTALTLRQESLNTLRRRGRKIISTNLTATWSTKCQGCPDPFLQGYIQPYSQVYCGLGNLRCNPDNNLRCKVCVSNPRFPLVIWVRPCSVGSSGGHTISPADPSLPTTEEGISGRDGKKNIQVQPGDMGGRSDRGHG